MKTRWILIGIGVVGLAMCGNAVAHGGGHRHDPVVTGGAGIWLDPYGNVQYAANIGIATGYGPGVIPVHRPDYGYRCDHRSHRAYERGYREGYRHGKRKGRKHRHHHRHY